MEPEEQAKNTTRDILIPLKLFIVDVSEKNCIFPHLEKCKPECSTQANYSEVTVMQPFECFMFQCFQLMQCPHSVYVKTPSIKMSNNSAD